VLLQADCEQTMPFGSAGRNKKGGYRASPPMHLEHVKKISFPHKKGEARSPQRLTLTVAKSDGEWQHSAFPFEPPTR